MTLQQQWDIWLAAYFMKKPSEKIYFCAKDFSARMKISLDELKEKKLKRFPEVFTAWNCMVSRYVCGYIKGADEFMFDSKTNAIQKAARLSRCISSAEPFDSAKARKETAEKQKYKKLFDRAADEYRLGSLQREAYGRRNWGACK